MREDEHTFVSPDSTPILRICILIPSTPSIIGYKIWHTDSTAAVNITDFDGGNSGDEIIVIFSDVNTTIVHGTNIMLFGGGNVTGSVGQAMSLVYSGQTGKWHQI